MVGRTGGKRQIVASVGMGGNLSAIVVGGDGTLVQTSDVLAHKAFHIVADGKYNLRCEQVFGKKVESQSLGHLTYYHACLVGGVGIVEHLSAGHGGRLRAVCLDVADAAWFPSPGMVDEEFGIHTEEFVQERFAGERHACQLSHGGDSVFGQFLCCPASHAPEVGKRAVVPELSAVFAFREFRYAHSILVGRHVLCHDVHGHLGQIHIFAYPSRGGNAGGTKYVADDTDG